MSKPLFGNPWNTACLDWEQRLLSGRTLVPDLPIYRGEADYALRTFKRLRIHDVQGTPQMEHAGGEWTFPIVEAMFGSLDEASMRRHINEFFLMIPKKNYKTGLGALIMLTALIINRRPSAEMTLIAPEKDVAGRALSVITGAIKLDPALDKMFHIQNNLRRITSRHSGAKLEIKAADTDAVTGLKSTFTLLDETHVFAKRSNAAAVFTEVRGSLASMKDGFFGQITTQSKEAPTGIFAEELAIARKVRDGKIDQPMLAVLYELPERMQLDGAWKERRYWPVINPNMGRSVDENFLASQLVVNEVKGAAAMALFASQHFNVQVGIGLHTDRWPGADFWLAAAEPALTFHDLLKRSEVVVVGIDGGGLDDLLGLNVMGREKKTGKWLSWSHAWAHKIVLERRKEIAPALMKFAEEKTLTLVETPGKDIEEMADLIMEIEEEGLLAEENAIGVDSYGVGVIVDELTREERGIEQTRIVSISMGWKLNGAIKTAERKVAGKELVHDGSPMMAWCVGNAKSVQQGNAVTITKQQSGSAKIDPLMALFNSVVLMSLNPAPAYSVYEDDEILV